MLLKNCVDHEQRTGEGVRAREVGEKSLEKGRKVLTWLRALFVPASYIWQGLFFSPSIPPSLPLATVSKYNWNGLREAGQGLGTEIQINGEIQLFSNNSLNLTDLQKNIYLKQKMSINLVCSFLANIRGGADWNCGVLDHWECLQEDSCCADLPFEIQFDCPCRQVVYIL